MSLSLRLLLMVAILKSIIYIFKFLWKCSCFKCCVSFHCSAEWISYVCVSCQSCLTLCDPMDCSSPPPLSMEFSRQENWNGWPFPSPGHFPNPGIEPGSPTLQADSLVWATRESALCIHIAPLFFYFLSI